MWWGEGDDGGNGHCNVTIPTIVQPHSSNSITPQMAWHWYQVLSAIVMSMRFQPCGNGWGVWWRSCELLMVSGGCECCSTCCVVCGQGWQQCGGLCLSQASLHSCGSSSQAPRLPNHHSSLPANHSTAHTHLAPTGSLHTETFLHSLQAHLDTHTPHTTPGHQQHKHHHHNYCSHTQPLYPPPLHLWSPWTPWFSSAGGWLPPL